MTYRERLKQYQEGMLEGEEKKKVEEEIEKYQAISDYLYESEEIPELQELLEADVTKEEKGQQETEFVALVNQSIKKAFRKMGFRILAISLVLILFLQFMLPRLVASMYYNPGKKNGEYSNQMSLDMAVYSELFLPGKKRQHVSVDDRGYGKYHINIAQSMSYNGSFINTKGEIERGKLRLYDDRGIRRPTGNAFAWSGVPGDGSRPLSEIIKKDEDNPCAAGTREHARETLENLIPGQKYIGYVSLDRIMDYEEFIAFMEGQEDLGGIWCAVDTGHHDNHHFYATNIGFNCILDMSSDLEWDEKMYPELILWNQKVMEERSEDQLEENMKTEGFMKTHFCSMMRYMADQKEFYEMMGSGYLYSAGLQGAIDYIEKEGIRVYGFASVMDREKALELSEQKEVYEIFVENLE